METYKFINYNPKKKNIYIYIYAQNNNLIFDNNTNNSNIVTITYIVRGRVSSKHGVFHKLSPGGGQDTSFFFFFIIDFKIQTIQQKKTLSSFSSHLHTHTRRIKVPLFPAHHQLYYFTPNSRVSPAEEHGNYSSGPGGPLGL